MKALMVMFDSLNRHMLGAYGCDWTYTPNFDRLARQAVTFDKCYVGSMPCMPARRELHTGRCNFLHRSWGPLEPFDDSMPELLKNAGIYTHLATDHYHYFEDGGCTYHTRYSSYEAVRGQEGDGWKALADYKKPDTRNTCEDPAGHWVEQDFINRAFMPTAEEQPQTRIFANGLEFLDNNHALDNWFLQIETFDPHEPFFSQEEYKKLFPHTYTGRHYDWPPYRALNGTEDDQASVNHLRMEYAALLSMCDACLGRVLDKMDQYGLWDDTMLIVNTDHGFLLGEHGFWAKCHCPFYNEVAHTPLFIWDPRSRVQNQRRGSLVQTIDLPATLLQYFGQALPKDMQGQPLGGVITGDETVRRAALFGIFGGQVNCTDGRWVYMRQPIEGNRPLCQYTLMPTRHGGRRAFIDSEELKTMQLHTPFSFTKGIPILKTCCERTNQQHSYPTALFDLETDPGQMHPVDNPAQEMRMAQLMEALMRANDAPLEQFVRMGFA